MNFLAVMIISAASAVPIVHPGQIVMHGRSSQPVLMEDHVYDTKRTPFKDFQEGMLISYWNPYWRVEVCHPIHRTRSGRWYGQAINPVGTKPDPGYITPENYHFQVIP